MGELQRITTQFVAGEDRLRLAGEGGIGDARVLWLTRRLVDRLVPVLVRWLEEQAPVQDAWQGALLQSFAQQAASASLVPQAPVLGAPNSVSWLVIEVDIARGARQIGLRFKSAAGEQASLSMEAQPLRQWLGILYTAYQQAEWPLALWPQWLREAGEQIATPVRSMVH